MNWKGAGRLPSLCCTGSGTVLFTLFILERMTQRVLEQGEGQERENPKQSPVLSAEPIRGGVHLMTRAKTETKSQPLT